MGRKDMAQRKSLLTHVAFPPGYLSLLLDFPQQPQCDKTPEFVLSQNPAHPSPYNQHHEFSIWRKIYENFMLLLRVCVRHFLKRIFSISTTFFDIEKIRKERKYESCFILRANAISPGIVATIAFASYSQFFHAHYIRRDLLKNVIFVSFLIDFREYSWVFQFYIPNYVLFHSTHQFNLEWQTQKN